MNFTRAQFQAWGAIGGRLRAQRLSKAKRKQIAKQAAAARPKKKPGRPLGSKNKTHSSKVDVVKAVALYKSGQTLAEIGLIFGVTREYVRQKIAEVGVTSSEGGQSIRSLLNAEDEKIERRATIERRERRIRTRWDISASQYDEIKAAHGANGKAGAAYSRYTRQRQSAGDRKIEWNITFAEWWKVWQDSRKYHLYGRGQGKYVMSRWGDTGAYEVGNVNIVSSVENNSDRPNKKSGMPTGVAKRGLRFAAQKMIGGKHYWIGTFPTPEQAHAAYLSFQLPARSNGKKR